MPDLRKLIIHDIVGRAPSPANDNFLKLLKHEGKELLKKSGLYAGESSLIRASLLVYGDVTNSKDYLCIKESILI
ncbi:MAG: hypothetical protein AMJ91_02135 [candidate division Zixibacteria bacterium SM23_73_3]|nr:MAG: hypothetical protein AMJ91_02135 [candidate division Zixibacteria bacterium SM23_73_3]